MIDRVEFKTHQFAKFKARICYLKNKNDVNNSANSSSKVRSHYFGYEMSVLKGSAFLYSPKWCKLLMEDIKDNAILKVFVTKSCGGLFLNLLLPCRASRAFWNQAVVVGPLSSKLCDIFDNVLMMFLMMFLMIFWRWFFDDFQSCFNRVIFGSIKVPLILYLRFELVWAT